MRGEEDGVTKFPNESNRAAIKEPQPVVNDRPFIQNLVIADIEARKAYGLRKYGTLLQPNNGRDALMDAYQEALDLVMYLRQAIEERNALLATGAVTVTDTDRR